MWMTDVTSCCVDGLSISIVSVWCDESNRHLHFFKAGFSLHTPPCSTLGGKQSESSVLKHSPSSSAVSPLSTQHEWQLPFQTTSPSSGLNPCRRRCPWVVSCPLHTWECPVSSVDPPVQQRAAQLQSLLGDCSSGPALSGGRGWSSELRPEKHSLPVWPGSQTSYTHTHTNYYTYSGWGQFILN